jgi:hypothetical protein
VERRLPAPKAAITEAHHRLLVRPTAADTAVSVVAVQAVRVVVQVEITRQQIPQAVLVSQVREVTGATLPQGLTARAVAVVQVRQVQTHRLELRATAAQVPRTRTTAHQQPTQVAVAVAVVSLQLAAQAAAVQAAQQEQQEQSTQAAAAVAVPTATQAEAAQVGSSFATSQQMAQTLLSAPQAQFPQAQTVHTLIMITRQRELWWSHNGTLRKDRERHRA